MRVEEIAGLQWKFIDLREGVRTISINNAISRWESVGHALERTNSGRYKTKNPISIRTIPIFDFYYELLIDYKESYMYEFGLNKEEIEECFVFPSIARNNPYKFMRSQTALMELKRVLKALDMPNTDLQMFRHSCATFLILPPPDGLGYTEEKVIDYFGHQDTQMLKSIYARLTQKQKSERMRYTFSDIYKPDEVAERTAEEEMKERLLKRIGGDNEREKRIAREYRIHNQIEKAVKSGKQTYYYMKKDKGIIDRYIEKNGLKMDFVEVE
jgi:integrase